MTRRQERELREVRGIMKIVDGVLENWGIEMHRGEDIPGYDDREPSERFAAQIGDDESVEYEEVYALVCDVALELYNAGRMVTDVPLLAEYRPLRAEIDDLPSDRNIPVTEDSWKREHEHYEGGEDYSELSKRRPRLVAVEWTDPTETPTETMVRFDQETKEAWVEVKRLRDIISRAYGSQGWDIGSVKNLLIAGLEGYENSGWAKLHEPKPEPAPQVLSFNDGDIRLEFGEGSSEEGWWIELVLDDENNEDRVRLSLDDMDATKLSDRLAEKVREGRKDWS